MRRVITSAPVCRNGLLVPTTHYTRRRAVTMTYSTFGFEVFGKVQGVFFRANTVEKAKKLGVVGHVENTSRGTVTGEVQGEPKPVSLMKNWLQSEGPSGARIDKCSFSDASSDLDKLTYSSFEKH